MALYLKFPETGRPEYRDPSVILQSFLLVGADPFHAPVFVSWTLWHEMLFYAVFAVVIAAPRFGLALFGAWVVACLWQPFFLPHPPWPIYLTSFMNCLFGMGIAAAAALDRWRIPAARLLVAMGALTYLGTGLANDASSAIPVALSDALYGLGSALMLLGAVEAERCGKLRAPRWLVALGAASFSIYLTHMLTLPLIGKVATRLGLTHTVPAWAAFPGMAIAAALAGLVVHYLFEKRIVAFSRSAAEAVAQVFGGRQAAIAVKKESIPSED
jgi:peptidoglycan/LPS O-acetylase OafA/YrhL